MNKATDLMAPDDDPLEKVHREQIEINLHWIMKRNPIKRRNPTFSCVICNSEATDFDKFKWACSQCNSLIQMFIDSAERRKDK